MKILSITSPLPSRLIFIFLSWRMEVNFQLVNWPPSQCWNIPAALSPKPLLRPDSRSLAPERWGDPPGDEVTAVEVHNSYKLNKSMFQTDVGDSCRPGNIWPIDAHILKKIRINLMFLLWKGQPLSGIDRLYPENPHQTSRSESSHLKSSTFKLSAHPPAPICREVQVDLTSPPESADPPPKARSVHSREKTGWKRWSRTISVCSIPSWLSFSTNSFFTDSGAAYTFF